MKKLFACLIALAAACALPVLAHHSGAMFDSTRTQTITGKIVEFNWVNPHSSFKVEVTSPKEEILAQPATIKEGENEVRVVLTAAPDARTGTPIPLTIRATAMFHDVPVVHETKAVTLVITK